MDGIVFISLFLGLTSGTQWVEMRADPQVKAIRLTFDGRELAMLRKAPWQTRADFGADVLPGELVATGWDDGGNEIARGVQLINVPRRVAELQIVLQKEQGRLRLVSYHREASRPKRAEIWFDATRLKVEKDFSARLPPFDGLHSHVVAAEMRFEDGAVARADLVIHGGFSDSVGAQLTPIALTRTAVGEPATLEECFSSKGRPLHVTPDETTGAVLYIVKDPDPAEALDALDPTRQMHRRFRSAAAAKKESPLDAATWAEIVWPVAKLVVQEGRPPTKLFARTEAPEGGMRWKLTMPIKREGPLRLEFADAVAVAGLRAMTSGRRRAVVLLLSSAPDESERKPAVVRRYLQSIGVPLFVWSLTGERPDLNGSWGDVEDISTREKLGEATARLRAVLASQRIVWVPADPVNALRIEADPRCGLVPLAR